jgi:predicted Zn-dependent protease with MMP-like domain
MNRYDLLDELPEEVAKEIDEYVPDSLPDKLNPDSEAEAEGMYVGVALAEWAIHEKGLSPKEANELIQLATADSEAAALLDQLGLPNKLFRN